MIRITYLLLFLGLLQTGCNSKHEVSQATISFPYQLSDTKNIDIQNCLNGTNSAACEKLSWKLAAIGAYYPSLSTWNVLNQKVYTSRKDSLMHLNDYQLIPAKSYLLERIQLERVVMINEAHHLPHHRITSMGYLEALYEMGFRYLGVEGLAEAGEDLMARKTPTIHSGYYLKEPQYANFLKKAISLGYTIVKYDMGGRGKERELKQAEKLAEILERDSSAKLLVHAGWGHIREDTLILGGLMASEFRKKTGINPFTINQTRFNEHSNSQYEHFIYQALEPFSEPSLLLKKEDQTIYTDSITDVILFHPRTNKLNQRPDYLKKSQLYHSKIINYHQWQKERLLILLYDQEEKVRIEERVAIDVTVKEAGIKEIELFFPPKGRYEVYAIDIHGKVRDFRTLKK